MKNQTEIVNQVKNNNQTKIKSLEIRSKSEEEAIQKAKKTNCLGKALECEIPETIYERMSKYLKMK